MNSGGGWDSIMGVSRQEAGDRYAFYMTNAEATLLHCMASLRATVHGKDGDVELREGQAWEHPIGLGIW